MRNSTSRGSGLALVGLLLLAGLLRGQQDDDSSPYHEALLNYKAGNYAAARVAVDDAERDRPNDVGTAILKARIMTEQGDFGSGAALLRRYLTENGPLEVQLALGDLFLRQRDFGSAANLYDQALSLKPGDPDIMLRLIYARINTGDLVAAGKFASRLKPLDPLNPSYYYAKAALSSTAGDNAEADQDLLTARTIYGNTVANRYLKTYLEVFAPKQKANPSIRSEPPPASSTPAPASATSQ